MFNVQNIGGISLWVSCNVLRTMAKKRKYCVVHISRWVIHGTAMCRGEYEKPKSRKKGKDISLTSWHDCEMFPTIRLGLNPTAGILSPATAKVFTTTVIQRESNPEFASAKKEDSTAKNSLFFRSEHRQLFNIYSFHGTFKLVSVPL